MEEKNKAVAIIKKAQEDLSSGKITRRDFNSIMMAFGAIAGYTLFNSFAHAWTGTRMRKSSGTLYQITRSLRLRANANAYLTRTPASAGNRQTFTWSGWIKRGALALQNILQAGTNPGGTSLYFGSDHCLHLTLYITAAETFTTTQVFRDPAAWYHIVFAVDTTQATSSNRVKLYVNGLQITSFSTLNYPAQNTSVTINSTTAHTIGLSTPEVTGYLDAFLAEINFIDGQALTASSFGQTDATTGAWTPKKYSGAYGTNGYFLDLKDPTTTTTISYDRSGNLNHFTSNNISVTTDATYDSMTDVPFNSGALGNFATINPLYNLNGGSVIEGNSYSYCQNNGGPTLPLSTMMVSKGKWYFEMDAISNGGYGQASLGVKAVDLGTSYLYWLGNGGDIGTYGTYACAFDADTGKIWIRNSAGTWTGDPVAGTSPSFTTTANTLLAVACYTGRTSGSVNPGVGRWNFGQRPFTYSIPTGYKTLHTGNLPTPTIIKSKTNFDIVTRVGTAAAFSATGISFKPDFVLSKSRNNAYSVIAQDSIRGTGKYVQTDTTSTEATDAQMITSFNSNGFSGGTATAFNSSGSNMVDWLWKGGGTAVSNTQGLITSQVSANQTAGFSVVQFIGNGSGTNTSIGHGLSAIPSMYFIKNIGGATNWFVYHKSLGNNGIWLNSSGATFANSAYFSGYPSSNTIFVSTDTSVNTNGNSHIAYVFAEIDGFSKFGSYTGNGSTDGAFVYCGFRPRWIMTKRIDGGSEHWNIFDSSRDGYNSSNKLIYANLANAEDATTGRIDFVSNGFKARDNGSGYNTSAATYIFAAFAEAPFKYAGAR